MSESASVVGKSLTVGQLNLLASKVGVHSGKSFIDVGCGNGEWLLPFIQAGKAVQGMDEKGAISGAPGQHIIVGSPSANVPWEPHSIDTILFRGTSLHRAAEFGPELMIGLANLGSSLKAKGRLIIPVVGTSTSEVEAELTRWKNQLSVFPGTFQTKTLKPGLSAYLTLAFLFGRSHQVSIIDFQVNKNAISRLEWHKLARNAVMARMNAPAVA
ncbi:hypothetical protein SH668x_003436 [Planctomicrobium sp. SH668]|uniref:hypothetical protein n=1 Tax=Planctomicrobium sp. SH668 TaxID=3448126 RepID=UPI003F5C50C9